MTTERTGGPGPRKEIGTAASSQAHPPHVTENDKGAQVQNSSPSPTDVPVLGANAHGQDLVATDEAPAEIREESMYGGRPGEHKDRRETDMP
ncbi:MAG TPA: hypothetical protein VF665_17505 [Longimicrobium sp.]|jgi:hypothetical protein|uniref:hypothetical protein n=1 Tax=Longimicrobium sp. TaxID=2029185 RepID=UPI002ED8EA64